MNCPIFQYSSINVVLTAATARVREASINRWTASKSLALAFDAAGGRVFRGPESAPVDLLSRVGRFFMSTTLHPSLFHQRAGAGL